ncbi:MAG: GDP-mannose 4,6-dehydratase [Chlamydiota bacterium]
MKPTAKPAAVFITGIAGFIGFHLASFLHKRGDYVIGCDNFNYYYSPELKKTRATLLRNQGIEVIDCDICTIAALKPLFEQHRFSHLVHLAAQAGVRYSLTHPHSYSHANLDGTLHVLEMCRHFQPLGFIFASSSSVYGNTTAHPCLEDSSTDAPVSLYAATKKSGELLAKSYHHLYQIPTTVLRFFTSYGPWGRPDMAYFSFAKAITNNRPIELFNRGQMKRDFTYIDDIVYGISAAIDRCKKGYEVYNLGSGSSEPLAELVQCLESALEKKAQCLLKPMQPGDVTATWADITKAKRALGFQPKVKLREGIQRFATWYVTHNSSDFSCQPSSIQAPSTHPT